MGDPPAEDVEARARKRAAPDQPLMDLPAQKQETEPTIRLKRYMLGQTISSPPPR